MISGCRRFIFVPMLVLSLFGSGKAGTEDKIVKTTPEAENHKRTDPDESGEKYKELDEVKKRTSHLIEKIKENENLKNTIKHKSPDHKGILLFDGIPVKNIVLPDNASPSEQYIAGQIKKYLYLSFGLKIPVKKRGETKSPDGNIFIETESLSSDKPENKSKNDESFIIRTHNGNLILRGGGERGTVYAGNYFLKKYTGIRWYCPGIIGEEIPRNGKIELSGIDEKLKPAFFVRSFGNIQALRTYNEDTVEWGVRNNINFDLGEYGKGKGGSYTYGLKGHNFNKFVPVSMFREHPEYFRLTQEGIRKAGLRSSRLCLMNKDVQDIFINTCRQYFRQKDIDLMSIVPDDGGLGAWCKCDKCTEANGNEKRQYYHGGADRNCIVMSNLFFTFLNIVARKMASEFPGKYITTCAYNDYTDCPNNIPKIEDNIIVTLCQDGNYNHPFKEGVNEESVWFRKNLREWSKISKNLSLYRYMYKAFFHGLPWPTQNIIYEDLQSLKKLGGVGMHVQVPDKVWGVVGLNMYVAACLLFDIDQDINALLEDYYKGYYREAAGTMRKYHECLEKSFISAPPVGEKRKIDPYKYAPLFLTPEVLKKCRSYLDEANRLASDDKTKWRILRVDLAFTHAELFMLSAYFVKKYLKTGEPRYLEKLTDIYENILKLAEYASKIDALNYNKEGKTGIYRLFKTDKLDALRTGDYKKIKNTFKFKHDM